MEFTIRNAHVRDWPAVAGLLVKLGAPTDRRDRLTLQLDRAGVEQWVGALNDVRLTIGVVLGVTEDDDDEDPPPDDPRAAGMATYHWLTWVQGTLVEVLMEGM